MEKQEEKEILNSFLATGNRIPRRPRRIKTCPKYCRIIFRQMLKDLDIEFERSRRAH